MTLDGINGTFTLSLSSGDSSSNTLVFDLKGSNPPGALPAAGLAAEAGAALCFAAGLALVGSRRRRRA